MRCTQYERDLDVNVVAAEGVVSVRWEGLSIPFDDFYNYVSDDVIKHLRARFPRWP